MTDYPPPRDFAGTEWGRYGSFTYRRTLTAEEQAGWDAGLAIAARDLDASRRHAFGLDPQHEQPALPAPPPIDRIFLQKASTSSTSAPPEPLRPRPRQAYARCFESSFRRSAFNLMKPSASF